MTETYRFALVGNPNVGKSSLFNALTGLHQHTGNWPGKTVATAAGTCSIDGAAVELIDLPGTYSLSARSPEEEVAAEYISFGSADAVIVVCDATALERNLYLALQVMEITDRVVICVNLMDEAGKRGITVDLPRLSQLLGVRVVGTSARQKKRSLPCCVQRWPPRRRDTASRFRCAMAKRSRRGFFRSRRGWMSCFPGPCQITGG